MRRWMWTFGLVLAVVACRNPPKAPLTAEKHTARPMAERWRPQPITDKALEARVQAWVAPIVERLNARDSQPFDAALDVEGIVRQALQGTQASDEFVRGALTGARESAGMGKRMVEGMAADGRWQLLRVRQWHGNPTALLRMSGEVGVNYVEMVLQARPNAFQATDLYLFIAGERVSEMLQRVLVQLVQKRDRSLLARLRDPPEWSDADIGQLRDMGTALHAGQAQRALDVFATMAPHVRKLRNVQLLRVQAAKNLDDQTYSKVMTEFQHLYPNDPSLLLTTLDLLVIKERFADAAHNVSLLAGQLDGDPYLDEMAVGLWLRAKQPDKAAALVAKAVAAGPREPGPRWQAIDVALHQHAWPVVVRELDFLGVELGVELTDLQGDEVWAGFRQTPDYAAWNERRLARQGTATEEE